MHHAHWAHHKKTTTWEINYIPTAAIYRKGNPDS